MFASISSVFRLIYLGVLGGTIVASSAAQVVNSKAAATPVDVAAVPANVKEALANNCTKCHGEKKQKGKLRLDTFAGLSTVMRLELLGRAEEQVHFEEMPPDDEKQPSAAERKLLSAWLHSEVLRLGGADLEDKLRYPDYGNNVDHDKLFSGQIKEKAFSPSRRWLVRPQIFEERMLDIFTVQPRETISLRKQGFYGVTNPFLLPDKAGVRDYDNTALDGGHLLLLLNNAEWISNKQLWAARIKKGEFKADQFENPKDKWYPKVIPGAFEKIVLNPSKPTDAEINDAIQAQFDCVLRRKADDKELAKYLKLTRSALDLGGNTEGLRQMLVTVLLESEFLYRQEFGDGKPDASGRQMLTPVEGSYAISYALGDRRPDAKLVQAAQSGHLSTKEDYRREVLRLLGDNSYFEGAVDKSLDGKHYQSIVTSHPRINRFFRDFFGYPNALKVFKDKNRSNGFYENPERGTAGTPGVLVVEADMLVDLCIKQDKHVFENLLGTEKFIAAPVENAVTRMTALNEVYEHFKDTKWQTDPKNKKKPESTLSAEDLAFIRKRLNYNSSERDLDTAMTHIEYFKKKGLNPNPIWSYPFGVHMLKPHVNSYNISPPDWEYPKEQPFKLANRKGILTHPAWLIAHSENTATDPVRRGRWIREKLLAGRVPDVPITVDAKIPEDPHKTLRERLEMVTTKEECWKCHQHMNPLGLAFEMFDDFGRYRTAESLEHPENVIEKTKSKYGADTYKTAPVNCKGSLDETGDPKLDGEVKDAIEMIDRLAKSKRVRQSIIRYAFRFFMGRNEMLSDSQTLIDADNAYAQSEGSFNAVVVSLLTSDSFMYRKPVSL